MRSSGGSTTITIEQRATGGIKGETEIYHVDGVEYPHASAIFGAQHVRTQWLDLSSQSPTTEVATERDIDFFLREGWLEEDTEGSPEHIVVMVRSDKGGWRVEQTWGFALIDGKRYHVKKSVIMKGEERACVRAVYERVRG